MIKSFAMVALATLLAGSTPTAATAETVAEAHAKWNAALSEGDVEAIEALLAPDGRIVFSLQNNQTEMTLAKWFTNFRGALETGTAVAVSDRVVRSGGGDRTGWVFAVQDLSWTPEGDPKPAVRRVWYTTEVWEQRDGGWMVVHIHHGIAPEDEEDASE